MTLPLIECLTWPQTMGAAMAALVQRATGSQVGAQGYEALAKVSTWQGQAGAAAKADSLAHSRNANDSADQNLQILGSGALVKQNAEALVAEIRRIKEDAVASVNGEPPMDVNLVTNTVMPPTNANYTDMIAAGKAAKKEASLQARLDKAVTDATLMGLLHDEVTDTVTRPDWPVWS